MTSMFRRPIHSAAGVLPSKLRRFHGHRVNAFPVHSIDQRHQLSLVELNPAMPDLRPAKLRLLKTFRIKTDAGSIPKYDFDSVGPFCTEDIKRAIEWIAAGVTDQRQQSVY